MDELIRDHAAACAAAILEIVGPCLREEEKCEAAGLFRAAVEACGRRHSTMICTFSS
ncbi:MAG: hypothetical protein K2X91_18920 [Thermoleophilia bacterium]|nr:hypothetical protein [Thermoleophilia bacterium]